MLSCWRPLHSEYIQLAHRDYEAFVAHKWSKTDTQAKRIRIPRNANKLRNVYAMLGGGEIEIAAVDEVFQESTELVEKTRVNFPRSATTMKSHQSCTVRQLLTPSGASR